MALTLRLYRTGKKGRPSYRIVAVNKRYKANGTYIEQVGKYDPLANPVIFAIDKKKYDFWLSKGAVISEGLRKLLKNKKI